jgi:hypothetical protein
MNNKCVLIFGVKPKKQEVIENICQEQGWDLKEVDKKMYKQTLASILGIKDIPTTDSENTKPVIKEQDKKFAKLYETMGFPVEMMVFCGFDKNDLDIYLDSYKLANLEPVPLKAMLTQHNVGWTAIELFMELMEEHRMMAMASKK